MSPASLRGLMASECALEEHRAGSRRPDAALREDEPFHEGDTMNRRRR